MCSLNTLHDSFSLRCFVKVLHEIWHVIVIIVVIVVASGTGSISTGAASHVTGQLFQVGEGFSAKLVQDS